MNLLDRLIYDRSRRLRTIWRFLIFGVGAVGIQIVIILGVLGCLTIAMALDAVNGPNLEGTAERPDNDFVLGVAVFVAAPQAILNLLWVAVCRIYLDRRTLTSIGLRWPIEDRRINIGVGFLCGAAPIAAVTLILLATGHFHFVGNAANLLSWLLIPALLLAAFFEELVVRGYLLRNMMDIERPVAGVAATSIIFWLMHSFNPHAWQNPWIGINLFGAGVLLALAYIASENLWFPTFMHFAWNVTQGVVFGIPISGMATSGFLQVVEDPDSPRWLTGGAFGLEATASVTAAQLAVAAGLLLWIRGKTRTT